MCTAVACHWNGLYFGRTLDHDCSYGESVTLTPRCFPLQFRNGITLDRHYGILGIAHVVKGYPLYYDAVNEKGVAMAGLHFVGNASYCDAQGANTIAQFEVIPWLLSQCSTAKEAAALLKLSPITREAFGKDYPPAPLHWLLADKTHCFTVEPLAQGLQITENPIGVLTNNPPFPQQLNHLADFQHLSPAAQTNTLLPGCDLPQYSRGMGAIGLPGDLSSKSRFVRAAFTKYNSVLNADPVTQIFHILGSVSQTKGCCHLQDGKIEFTRYTSCCDAAKGIYYYTTYHRRRITAVSPEWEGEQLTQYPLRDQEDIHWETGRGS